MKLLLGGAVSLALMYGLYLFGDRGLQDLPAIDLLALPGAFFLTGLIEFLTGKEFSHWSESWDRIKWWQRGILGLMILGAAFAMMFIIAMTIGEQMSRH